MKKLTAFVLIIACVFSLVSCSDKNLRFNIEAASSIVVTSGLTGDKVILADKEFIQKITENINSLSFERASPSDEDDGYIYSLTWLDKEDDPIETITITEENGYQIRRDGYYYRACADLAIDTEMIYNYTAAAKEAKGAYTYEEMCKLPADELLDLFIQNGLIISDELKKSFTEEELRSLFKDNFVLWHTGECLMDYTAYIDLAEQTKIIYESIVRQ